MYREKDYNRNNRENTKSSGGKRSRVVQGDSVFDDPSVSRRVKPKHLGVSYLQEEEDAFHTDKPHRKKAVRSIPREERYEHRYEEPKDWAAEMFEDKPSLKERLSFSSRRKKTSASAEKAFGDSCRIGVAFWRFLVLYHGRPQFPSFSQG